MNVHNVVNGYPGLIKLYMEFTVQYAKQSLYPKQLNLYFDLILGFEMFAVRFSWLLLAYHWVVKDRKLVTDKWNFTVAQDHF